MAFASTDDMTRGNGLLVVPDAILLTAVLNDVISSARPRVVGWQVVKVNARGGYEPVGERVRWRALAEAIALNTFPDIIGWSQVGHFAYVARRRSDDASPAC